MGFWNKKVNVSREAAQRQVAIISQFSSEKRMKIALDFANMGIRQTRIWIKKNNPNYSELEINLEFVRLMYYERGEMTEQEWYFYKTKMEEKIRKNWSDRFRKMMKERNWNYEDIALMGNFKSGKVIEATISRGLPSFAKISVLIHETSNKK